MWTVRSALRTRSRPISQKMLPVCCCQVRRLQSTCALQYETASHNKGGFSQFEFFFGRGGVDSRCHCKACLTLGLPYALKVNGGPHSLLGEVESFGEAAELEHFAQTQSSFPLCKEMWVPGYVQTTGARAPSRRWSLRLPSTWPNLCTWHSAFVQGGSVGPCSRSRTHALLQRGGAAKHAGSCLQHQEMRLPRSVAERLLRSGIIYSSTNTWRDYEQE